ncbi:GH18231 [Drosophila grimshawi]|uniref:GH18231 n=2 Tax=Drosophila grimshawi TaxID=7222 RepID=B4JFN3_DROGR|nr:GH18231 [Drosophila grimshawi]
MLHELTQNDPLLEHTDDKLPQHLCGQCLSQLEAAYAFVVQVRQTQEQLLLQLRNGLQTQCLDETPIDISTEHIKIEADIDLDADMADLVDAKLEEEQEKQVALKCQPATDSDSSQDNVKDHHIRVKTPQLRRSARRAKLSTDSENESSEQVKPLTVKRGRGRPARLAKRETTTNEDGRHVCEVCGKTFSWYRDMQRHARIHFEQAGFVCEHCGKKFLRKDKYMTHLRSHKKHVSTDRQTLPRSNEWRYAERLYSPGRFMRVECKLCGLSCQRIRELREHLASHVHIETLSNLSLDNDVIREQFGSQLDLQQIKEKVCTQIAKGREQLENYCDVVNAYGYEQCLSDSDEEEEGELTGKYQCLRCNVSFTRKHQLMGHTLEEHTDRSETLLERCNICQIGFVCAKLLEQHKRTQCLNPLKRYSCENCPGKFIWLQNLQQHACCRAQPDMQHRRSEQQQAPHHQIQCCLCKVQPSSMAALRSHLLTHRDGYTGIDPQQQSAFFRTYYDDDGAGCLSELRARIAGDFEAQLYGRYFNACTDSGQELDFNDSDKEWSDAPILHSCAVCGESRIRLDQLLQHQQSQHIDLAGSLPHVCSDCGLGYVAESLLQQHRRRICAKLHAKYECPLCSHRFYWHSNYERHIQVQHPTDTKQEQEKSKLQCSECDKVFIWPKDLTRHKRMHQSQVQFECAHCDRKFHRKDGLKSHMRMHGEQPTSSLGEQLQRMPMVLNQLCRPNGCKQIKCMICLSQHTKISDLRTHLTSHQLTLCLAEERGIANICRALYPELSTPLNQQALIKRIQRDLTNDLELERFVSITNEAGIELSLDSSETDTDSDYAVETERSSTERRYSCELCQVQVMRKHQLYAHQLEQHTWHQTTHVCSHCQARFVNEQLLEHHYSTLCRNAQRRFLCRKCPLRFRWRDNLKLHNSVAHQERGTVEQDSNVDIQLRMLPVVSYDCVECKRSFKMQKDLTRHTLMHAKESSIYRCRWCARRFYREANLLQHIERHGISADQLPYAEALLNASRHPHGPKCIQCRVCELSFGSIAALRSHLQSSPVGTHHPIESMANYSITNQLGYELHLDDSETDEEAKPAGTPAHYTCGMCQLRCVRKFELHQHQQAMHRLERIADGCNLCIFKSVSPDLIAYHRRVLCENTEKQFKCSKCSYKFMWQSNLVQHIQLQHPSSEESPTKTAMPKTVPDIDNVECHIFQCGQCPSKYNRKDRLTAHVKKCHTAGATALTKSAKAATKQQKSFLCAFCGKAVSSSSNLIIHIRRHTGEKPFKCDYCDMAFPRSSDLQCHRRTHTGERPHICTVCKKGFARSYKLQQHMRIHNGERPYKCTFCDKSFTQSNDLTLHIRRHTGERPYQCNTCGERFIQGTALKNHRQQNGHYETEVDQSKDD